MEYSRTRFTRTPGRYRRRGAQAGASGDTAKKNGLPSVLIGQSVICAAVLIFALVFRFANSEGYRNFKKGINESFLGSKSLAELATRFESFAEGNGFFAGIFGPDGAIPIFRFGHDASSSGGQSGSGGDSSASAASQHSSGSVSGKDSSGDHSSHSGSGTGSAGTASASHTAAPMGGDAFFYDEIILEDLYSVKGYANIDDNIETKIIMLPQPLSKPVSGGWVSSPFADRENPFTGKREFHPAVDVAVPEGTPVYAVMDGTVSIAGSGEKSGKYILLEHGGGIKTVYAHLNGFKVTAGEKVRSGQQIAFSGNTGATTGPHLHFEMRHNDKYMNPSLYFECLKRI